MKVRTQVDLNEVKRFFEPHDGQSFMGATARLPVQIKSYIDALDGRAIPVREAIDPVIQLAGNTPGEVIVDWDEALHFGSILLLVGRAGSTQYMWKLISFRDP